MEKHETDCFINVKNPMKLFKSRKTGVCGAHYYGETHDPNKVHNAVKGKWLC